jgi:hypothetical protein
MDESTHDIPVGLGPTWMNKASNILLTILPSSSSEVRRAAAEGLAFLATLGVKEDMHFLQSSVLHSLDELISGAASQVQGRNTAQADDSQPGRSGALLTLACMQRNSFQIKERRVARSRLRGSPGGSKYDVEDSLPAIQIMIRLLPYTSGQSSTGVSLAARTFALHALLLLLEYSGIFKHKTLSDENLHLLKKSVETVEDNFLSAWTVASHVLDQGSESTKVASESAFLSVLLRSMTFFTPFLYHLDEFDSGVARRFSTMATIIIESAGYHPVVQCEAMAFFEVLVDHQSLLPPHSGGIKYDEHPILCSIPFLLNNITPGQTKVLKPNGIWLIPQGCHSSKLCLRATLRVLEVLSISQIMVAEWSDMKAVSILFAALEGNIASTSYAGEALYRGVAAPREGEIVYQGGDPSSEEIPSVLRYILFLERTFSNNPESFLLRYILISRSLLIGISGSREDDEEGFEGQDSFTVSGITKAAVHKSVSDVEPVFELANPIRWQVKAVAVQVANIALKELASKCKEDGVCLPNSESFNPTFAAVKLTKQCRDFKVRNLSYPKSLLSMHIAEVVAASCVAATATVDQVELRILQENAMHFLVNIIECFGSVPDPDQPYTSVLHEYVPQISSCIKSALAAKDEMIDDEIACRLFWVGCDALRAFIETGVTDDKGVLKRIVRPALLAKDEVAFTKVAPANVPPLFVGVEDDNLNGNMRSSLLVKIGKVWMLGNIPVKDENISSMLEPDIVRLGIHAAALAVDGARLLLGSDLTLCATPMRQIGAGVSDGSTSFFSFCDIEDIDDFVKEALTNTWATNARSSVKFLADAISKGDVSAEDKKVSEEWLKLVVPFLFRGISDAVEALGHSSLSQDDSRRWALGLDWEEVACCCLGGIANLASSTELLSLDEAWKDEVESSLIMLYKSVVRPVLVSKSAKRVKNSGKGMVNLIEQSCSLLKTLALSSMSTQKASDSSNLLMTLLSPLDLLQKGQLTLSTDTAATVVSACMYAIASIIESGLASNTIVKVMVRLVMSLSGREEKIPEKVRVASQELLKQCMTHEAVTVAEHSAVAWALAKSRDWVTWSVVVKVKDGIAAQKSLVEVENALLNPSYTGEQLTALAAVRCLIQSSPPPCVLAGRIIAAVGAETLSVFQAYGTLATNTNEIQSLRVTACTDCMKIVLAAYQQFTADCTDEEVSEYLGVLFRVFIAVLRFNGLPNHPLPHGALSDPSIGRMCAQAITHIARTTPIPFKSCMAVMSDHDRAVLEFAVRGEMSGYAAAPAAAPTKKKLSLKGFKT